MTAARAWFYDTWGFVALANRRDADHALAASADRWRERHRYDVVTTDYVLDETLTALHAAGGAAVARRFHDLLAERSDGGDVLLVDVTRIRRDAALGLFRKLAPVVPRLPFTDCTSFAVMRELGLKLAFTMDRHFHRAGGGIRPLFELQGGVLTWNPPE